ncbi:MAG: CfrBI family restriction endonuclease [Cytophagales bacterium]|nr:MAG: CfrBI family restriction endonuclease [Cytophagales bacterium]
MTLKEQVIKNILKRLIKGQDYRIEVVNLINAVFLQFAIDFFKKVVNAKLNNETITTDWYRAEFTNPKKFKPDEIAIHLGLNKKTITNMYKKAPREIILDASNEHYESLCELIEGLIDAQDEIDLTLTIKLRGVSADLTMNESLIVINTLAVKRAALRGGAWSSAGKQTEKLLMLTLCTLFEVPQQYFANKIVEKIVEGKAKKGSQKKTKVKREVDFYFMSSDEEYRCEVKLMGAGNSESADGVIARDSSVFIADTLSVQNKTQLDDLGVHWVELRSENGYQRFEKVLQDLGIPHTKFEGNIDEKLEEIFAKIF